MPEREIKRMTLGEMMLEASRTEETKKRKEEKREEGNFAEDYQDFGPELEWDKGFSVYAVYQKQMGRNPENGDVEVMCYFCPACEGWVKGEPHGSDFDDISDEFPLSGSEGTDFHCQICDFQVGKLVTKMS